MFLAQYKGLRRENYVLFLGKMVTCMGAMIWPMLTMILTQKMGLTASAAALVLAVANILMLPANIVGGKLADICNKKSLIILFDIVSVVCYVICGLIPMSWSAVILMGAASIFQSMERPAYTALVADITPTDQRDKAYSLLYLGANLGLVLAPTIGGFLFKDFLWLAFLTSGLAIACSTTLIFFQVKDVSIVLEADERASYQQARETESLWQILKENSLVLWFIVADAVFCVGYEQFNYLMPLNLGLVHGEKGAVIFGTITSVNCIICVVFTPLFTMWFSRLQDMERILFSPLLQTGGFLVFLLFIGHIPAYYLAITLFTWSEIICTISMNPYLSKRMPASHRGRLEGMSLLVRALFVGVGEIVIGQIFDHQGARASWLAAIGATLLAMIIWLVLLPKDRKTYKKLYD